MSLHRFLFVEVNKLQRKVFATINTLTQIVFTGDNIIIKTWSTLKYLNHLDEVRLIRCLFTNLMIVTDLQKPDKIYLDNTNLLYTLSQEKPEIGTVRETFLANQLTSTGHTVEYAGYKKGDFRVDGDIVIEVGGQDKGSSQIAGQDKAYVAADGIEYAFMHKIPLLAFGFLY